MVSILQTLPLAMVISGILGIAAIASNDYPAFRKGTNTKMPTHVIQMTEDNLKNNQQINEDEIQSLLKTENFDELEKIAARLRAGLHVEVDGLILFWKISGKNSMRNWKRRGASWKGRKGSRLRTLWFIRPFCMQAWD